MALLPYKALPPKDLTNPETFETFIFASTGVHPSTLTISAKYLGFSIFFTLVTLKGESPRLLNRAFTSRSSLSIILSVSKHVHHSSRFSFLNSNDGNSNCPLSQRGDFILDWNFQCRLETSLNSVEAMIMGGVLSEQICIASAIRRMQANFMGLTSHSLGKDGIVPLLDSGNNCSIFLTESPWL